MDHFHRSHFNFIPLVTFLLHSMSTSVTLSSKPDVYPEHKFVSGKTVEFLPNPIFYDTYVPIIYKIPIPKHNENALRLLWGDVDSCDKKENTGKLCPIAHHLSGVIKRLADDMGFWKPYYANHTGSKSEPVKKRTGFEVICNEIGPHFFRSYTSKAQLDQYLTALRACSRINQKVKYQAAGKENWVVDKTVYYRMLESFKTEYFNSLPQKEKVDWAVTLNTYTSVHGLLLTNHVLESVRLASALRICQSGIIPDTFVSMEVLKATLRNVSSSLGGRLKYQLVYDNLQQDIEEYYKLPLADCTFSDEYTLIIRILAPVKQTHVQHRLIQINTIPFLENLPSGSGIPLRLCRLRLPATKLTLVETNTGLLLDTRCEPNQLCKTSEVSTIFENDACTSTLLAEDSIEHGDDDHLRLITGNCKFFCFPIDRMALPLINRINSDTYVIVGDPKIKVNLNCFDKPTEMISLPMKNVGALRIKLACNCQLLYADHVSYRPRDPCTGKTTVEHILPYHWYNRELNTTLEKLVEKAEKEKNDKSGSESTTEGYNDIETYIENTTTKAPPQFSGDVEDEQIEKSVEKQEEDLGKEASQPQPTVKVQCNKIHSNGGMPAGMLVQLCMLWTLVTILGASTAYLLYHVRKLTKWRELQAYKETRVLYSIPKSPPEENNKIFQKSAGAGPGNDVRVVWDAFYDLFNVHNHNHN